MELRKKKKLILNFEENKKMEEWVIELICKAIGVGVLCLMFGRLLMKELVGGRR